MVLAGFGGGGVKEDDDAVVLNESAYMENIVRYSTLIRQLNYDPHRLSTRAFHLGIFDRNLATYNSHILA